MGAQGVKEACSGEPANSAGLYQEESTAEEQRRALGSCEARLCRGSNPQPGAQDAHPTQQDERQAIFAGAHSSGDKRTRLQRTASEAPSARWSAFIALDMPRPDKVVNHSATARRSCCRLTGRCDNQSCQACLSRPACVWHLSFRRSIRVALAMMEECRVPGLRRSKADVA